MRNSGTGTNRFALLALIAVAMGFVVFSATVGAPDSPRSTLPLVGNIMVFALVAHIALPQVVAVLSLREQFRRVSSCIIDGKYWTVLWFIFASILFSIAGALLADGGSLGSMWGMLARILSRGVVTKCAVVFAAVSLTMFVAYLAWLLPSASSTVAILNVLTSRIEASVRRGDTPRTLENLDNLTAIGREASSALARATVIQCLLRIGSAASGMESEKVRNRVLADAIAAVDVVVRSDRSEKISNHSREAIDGLAHLFRNSECGLFDDNRFIAAISSITHFAVTSGLTDIVLHGINKLGDIARRQLDEGRAIRVSLARLAFEFDLLSNACLEYGYPQGAKRILAILLRLTDTMSHAASTHGTPLDSVAWHTVSVCAQLVGKPPAASQIPVHLVERVWEATSRYSGSLGYAERLAVPDYISVHSRVRSAAEPLEERADTCIRRPSRTTISRSASSWI